MSDQPSESTDTPATPETENVPEGPQLKPTIQYDDFAKLDLRVATVVEAENHPNADRLLRLQVDLGPFGRRQICAGIRGHVEPADLVGKQVVVVANLAGRKIRGEESNGMLMAASDASTDPMAVVLLSTSQPVPAGSSVS
jgi:methionine--tRNA ligase beta chain